MVTPGPVVQTQVLAIAGVVVPETLPEMSDRIAGEWGVATATLRNLVWSESRWDPNAVSSTGDCGLVQINPDLNPSQEYVPCETAKDPAYALNFAAQWVAAGKEDEWVVCNCYLYLKTRIRGLPLMRDIVPNSTPKVGAVAIFEYKDKQTGARVKHVAIIEKFSATGFAVAESNFTRCLWDRRTIDWGDPHIVGFWSVNTGTTP